MSRPFAGSPLDGFFFSGAFFGPIGMSVKIVCTQDTVGSDSGLGRGLKQAKLSEANRYFSCAATDQLYRSSNTKISQ